MKQTGYWSIIQTPLSPFVVASIDDQILCAIFTTEQTFPLKYLKPYTDSVVWKQDLNESLQQFQTQLELYFNGRLKKFSLNLKMEGTSFQKECWSYLSTIPYGTTQSYTEQAKGILNSKAVRACGSANGKNPFHIIIPCHRIISKNGELGGFAAGTNIKQYLLDLEKKYK